MMDPLEWVVSLGNVNVAIYLNQTFGWVYGLVKMIIYMVIIFVIAKKLYNAWKFNYLVPISIIGPEKTITEIIDRGSLYKTKDNRVMFRLKKRGLMPFIPQRKDITPLYSRWWWQPSGMIRLYQFGSSNYSITPIRTTLAEKLGSKFSKKKKEELEQKYKDANKHMHLNESRVDDIDIKFTPVEPELGSIAQNIKEGMSTLKQESIWERYAPFIGAAIPFIIFAILLFFVAGKFVESAQANAHASEMIAEVMNKAIDSHLIEQSPEKNQVPQSNDEILGNNQLANSVASGTIPW